MSLHQEVQETLSHVLGAGYTRKTALQAMVPKLVKLLEEAGYAVVPKALYLEFHCGSCGYEARLPITARFCPGCGRR